MYMYVCVYLHIKTWALKPTSQDVDFGLLLISVHQRLRCCVDFNHLGLIWQAQRSHVCLTVVVSVVVATDAVMSLLAAGLQKDEGANTKL